MDMQGEVRIPAAREIVWEALNDPEVLRECITGCQSLEKTEDGNFEATVQVKVGPVKATFKGAVRLENVAAPESYAIVGEGKGGTAGFAKGSADVKLTEDRGETVLGYTVDAKVGGKLAQIGARLVNSTAKKYATEFFDKFAEIARQRDGGTVPTAETVVAPAPEREAPAEPPRHRKTEAEPEAGARHDAIKADIAKTAIGAADEAAGKRRGMSPMTWILILVIVLAGLTLLFGDDGSMMGTSGN